MNFDNIGNVEASVKAGGAIVGGNQTTTTTSTGSDAAQAQLEAALAQWRQELQSIIDKLEDEDDRDYVEKTANKMVTEAKKGEAADPEKVEGFLERGMITLRPVQRSQRQSAVSAVQTVVSLISLRGNDHAEDQSAPSAPFSGLSGSSHRIADFAEENDGTQDCSAYSEQVGALSGPATQLKSNTVAKWSGCIWVLAAAVPRLPSSLTFLG